MEIIRTKQALELCLEHCRKTSKTVGFVPTMGALHKGHLELVKRAKNENDCAVVSIFVNPTQFNNKNDLKSYPRNEKKDFELLEALNCDFVFVPEVAEMYPEEEVVEYDFKGIDKVMEGKYREGHFNGVAQIVSKLFKLIKPDKAYFGKKDFQQLAIINYLNKQYLPDLNIEIVPCEIVRESDGLAMSSRNMLLSEAERASASLIYRTLKKYTENYAKYSVDKLKEKIIKDINEDAHLEVEYVEIADNDSLVAVQEIIPGKATVCVAVYAGKVRLIDNFAL